eukprot:gene5540-biopygen4513
MSTLKAEGGRWTVESLPPTSPPTLPVAKRALCCCCRRRRRRTAPAADPAADGAAPSEYSDGSALKTGAAPQAVRRHDCGGRRATGEAGGSSDCRRCRDRSRRHAVDGWRDPRHRPAPLGAPCGPRPGRFPQPAVGNGRTAPVRCEPKHSPEPAFRRARSQSSLQGGGVEVEVPDGPWEVRYGRLLFG